MLQSNIGVELVDASRDGDLAGELRARDDDSRLKEKVVSLGLGSASGVGVLGVLDFTVF